MKHLILILVITGLFLFKTTAILAENVSGQSATLVSRAENTNSLLNKKLAIKIVLKKYDSPLVDEVDSFIQACEKYDLDCYLLPSIAGLESTFGRYILANSYNPFGWGGGRIVFANWSEGIESVAKGLKENYLNRGALTVNQIGRIYSESPTWAPRVSWFIKQFENEELKLSLLSREFPVKL